MSDKVMIVHKRRK